MVKTYPLTSDQKKTDNPSIQIYGNRIHADQSLYEYLIEFLLVFSSAKDVDGNGKLSFHDGMPTSYFVEPRNGFRRFVFFEQAKKGKIEQDKEAYESIKRILKKHINGTEEEKNVYLLSVQELFRGYAAVLNKRTWCAQELLPMCPEMIFCEQMPNDKVRKLGPTDAWLEEIDPRCDAEATFYDASFDLTRHNFMARGGEMYYLHLLQILKDDNTTRERLQLYLINLLKEKSETFSKLANWIEETWVNEKKLDKKELIHRMTMGYIPDGAYMKSGAFAIDELLVYLSNELHPVMRVELLAKGLVYQVLRMQLERTAEYLGDSQYPIVIDMRSRKGGNIIRQLSVNSFNRVTDAFTMAINKCIEKEGTGDTDPAQEYALFVKAKKESLDVFRAKSKELQCIIPATGPNERFSLSEDVVRFLVLSIVRPGERMDLNHFLRMIYEHFNIVIGPEEFYMAYGQSTTDKELVNSFIYNREAFQNFLKSAGFLRDLSDATSIVVNPYKEVELQ